MYSEPLVVVIDPTHCDPPHAVRDSTRSVGRYFPRRKAPLALPSSTRPGTCRAKIVRSHSAVLIVGLDGMYRGLPKLIDRFRRLPYCVWGAVVIVDSSIRCY